MTDPTPIPCIMPILAGPEMTEAAISDLLAQSVPVRLLLVNQGVDDAFRDRLERIAEQESDRVLVWSHQPSLPSLSASWNAALDWAWATGADCALVVNNDVRLRPRTVEGLRGCLNVSDNLFVSATGVTPEDYGRNPEEPMYWYDYAKRQVTDRGGPDFSCFLIARACHQRFRFDEAFIPCFAEDLDYHRRLMLAGEGQRIFSVNLPYLHLASQTLRRLEAEQPQEAARIHRQIETHSRAYYAKKWGGPVNAETFFSPFDEGTVYSTAGRPNPPTTTALFDYERTKWREPAHPVDVRAGSHQAEDTQPYHARPEAPLDSTEEIR